MGRLGLPSPERDFLIDWAMALTASTWQTILFRIRDSSRRSYPASFSVSLPAGMPVHSAMTRATSSKAMIIAAPDATRAAEELKKAFAS